MTDTHPDYSYESVRAEADGHAFDLDENHFYRLSYGDFGWFQDMGWPRRGGPDPERATDVLVGITIYHRTANGKACGGFVRFAQEKRADGTWREGPPIWTVESPWLTISPSVLDKGEDGCGGDHGFIKNNVWIPA